MTILYFDCFSGISGDMVLGAFLDLGLDPAYLEAELKKLNVEGFEIKAETTMKKGISGTDCHVILDSDPHHHRHFSDIKEIIEKSSLSKQVKETALAIFTRVAVAEAKVHKVSLDQVHFHEVGALDSIVDIVGASICYHAIKPDRVYASKINLGSGWVSCAHGLLPVPAPATAEILCQSDFEVYSKGIDGEAATPTGVAILTELATYAPDLPSFIPEKIGYGFGKKDFDSLNALRIMTGRKSDSPSVICVETNMDDMTGEVAGYVLELLFENHALDAFYTPIYMKKNRPGIHLSVLCEESNLAVIENIILKETSTIGIRKYPVERTCMDRHIKKLTTPYGQINLKVSQHGEIYRETPEYEDVKKIAKESGKSLREILEVVEKLK